MKKGQTTVEYVLVVATLIGAFIVGSALFRNIMNIIYLRVFLIFTIPLP